MSIVEKDDTILFRKKPIGSKPYTETWYLFGVELVSGNDPQETLVTYLQKTIGISVTIIKSLGWASEVKEDTDGEMTQFIYLDTLCAYISGEPQIPQGAEKIEWLSKNSLSSYDIVPPAVDLLTRVGYLSK